MGEAPMHQIDPVPGWRLSAMNNKRLIIVVLASMVIVWVWSMGNRWARQSHPEWFAQDQTAQPETAQPQTAPSPAVTQPGLATQATAPATGPAALIEATRPAVVPGQLNVVPSMPAGGATLGHLALDTKGEAIYPLGVKLQARGASLEAVVVNRSRREVDKDDPYVFQIPYEGADAAYKDALAARAVVVDGQNVDLANLAWGLASASADTATFSATVRTGEQPLLVIEKEFRLSDKQQPNTGYELAVRYTFRNPTGQPVGAKLIFNGPNVPQVETTRDIPELVIGYDGGEQTVVLEHSAATSYEFGKGETNLAHSKGHPILWAGFASAYFNGVLRSAALPNQGVTIAQATATAVKETNKESGQPFTALTFTTGDFSVPAGGTTPAGFDVYLGPRPITTKRSCSRAARAAGAPSPSSSTFLCSCSRVSTGSSAVSPAMATGAWPSSAS
jgi:YidC/Oxa1 family membrane protein insertase